MRKRLLMVMLVAILGFIVYRGNTTVGVTYYDISFARLPESFDSYTIVQLSDLHDAKFGDNHGKVVNQVWEIAPHAIFITGDFIDANRYDLAQSLLLVKELQHVAPIYYVTGNHEIATNDTERIKAALKDYQVQVLSDEAKIIRSTEGETIAIGGIEDPLSSPLQDEEAVRQAIARTFQHVPDDTFKILLSHRPEQFNQYVANRIDITFSGHAHGGQFRVPGIGGLISPGQGWFPDLTSGVHEKVDSRLVVSRGIGNSMIPIRLFNQPEIVVVTMKTE